jgi:hypothetical protein
VHEHGANAPNRAVRFVKQPQLSKQGGPVVIDLFTGQAIFVVKGEDSTEWNLDLASGCRQPAPRAEMPAANGDLDDNSGVACMAVSNVEIEPRQRQQQTLVIGSDFVASV